MPRVQRQIFYGLPGKFLFRLRYVFVPPVSGQHMVDLRLDTKHASATLKHMRLHGLAILLLFLSTSTAMGDAILESASRTVSAGRNAASSSTFGVFNQSVSDVFLLCNPSGCFDSLGAASASQASHIQPLVFSGNGQAGSAGEAPPNAASTFEASFTLDTPHLFNLSGQLTASANAAAVLLPGTVVSQSSLSLTGPGTSLNIIVATRGSEKLSRDLADVGVLPSGTYRLRVTAMANGFSFSNSNAAFQFTFALRVAPALVASVLPSGRSVQVGTPATAFATVINFGADTAFVCGLSPVPSLPATFSFALTDPATNQVIGPPDTPVNIQPGGSRSFVFAFTPTDIIPPQDVVLQFDCGNTEPAPVVVGVNTFLLSASSSPVPDIVALVATLTTDGIVNIPGPSGMGAFSVAAVNVGAVGSITISVDTGNVALPVALTICQTDSTTGICLGTASAAVTTMIATGETPTFAVFVEGLGNVSFAPAVNRVFVRFNGAAGVSRGATSVAVRTS